MQQKSWAKPSVILREYEAGKSFKSGLGTRGLYEQNKVNERFYVGDQWHGVSTGSDKPLVCQNVIKRIGDYKMAVIASNPISVNYSADGIPNTLNTQKRVSAQKQALCAGAAETEPLSDVEEIPLLMSALSDYFRVTAERVRFEDLKECALKNAYTFGTGLLYTYWDPQLKTGLYADQSHTTPITGDIRCEVLDVENVYFGDPTTDDVQAQPYILIAQRKRLEEIRLEMKRNGLRNGADDLVADSADLSHFSGDEDCKEPQDAAKATLITKLYKEWDDEGSTYRIKGVQICGNVIVRPVFDLGIRLYPIAKFSWERRKSCIYGESEITQLIPNQIAVNRMLTASVWSVMMTGLPIMVVNGDVVTQKISNDPGQILKVYGTSEDIDRAIRYVQPPSISSQLEQNVRLIIGNTLDLAGANEAALGDMNPDNTSAIIALREAAMLPMQTLQNRFYAFVEELARIWAEFWVMLYGKRALKIEDEGGVWYLPFDGERLRDTLISVRIDVGAASLWSDAQSVQTLDNLFSKDVINVVQYLQRLPKGIVPNVNGLIRELQQSGAEAVAPSDDGEDDAIKALPQAYRTLWDSLTEEDRKRLLRQASE